MASGESHGFTLQPTARRGHTSYDSGQRVCADKVRGCRVSGRYMCGCSAQSDQARSATFSVIFGQNPVHCVASCVHHIRSACGARLGPAGAAWPWDGMLNKATRSYRRETYTRYSPRNSYYALAPTWSPTPRAPVLRSPGSPGTRGRSPRPGCSDPRAPRR